MADDGKQEVKAQEPQPQLADDHAARQAQQNPEQRPPAQVSVDAAVQAVHAAVIAGHAEAVKQLVSAGAPQAIVQVHVDAIAQHASNLESAAVTAAAVEVKPEPAKAPAALPPAAAVAPIASTSASNLTVPIVIAVVAGAALASKFLLHLW